MSCLDDSTVIRFLGGHLEGAAHHRVEEELARCARCAALVAAIVRGRSATLGARSGACAAAAASDDDGDDPAAYRYILGGEIARGGMGTILAAYDRRLRRSVAIKCLATDDHERMGRFVREIQVTAALQHPGIVPIYDSGTLPDGRLFYAMRHVPGASMEHRMDPVAGAGDLHHRLDLLVSVLAAAEAVAYAHDSGIIHRDLKPSNILVGPFGETVIIDWGLARVDGDDELGDRRADEPVASPVTTGDGAVLGTPRYMAPEQARGEPATRRSDVYALGAILYHALSGAPPVDGVEISAVLDRAARAEVRPLVERAPGLPGDLVAIVERAMQPAPADRYASAGELAADLRRFQTGQLVAAHAYSRGELVRRFVRRHRGTVVLAALFTVVLAAGGVVSISGIVAEREHAERQRLHAELQRHTAVREREGAEALIQFLLGDLRGKLTKLGRLDALSSVADRVEAYFATTAAERADRPDALGDRAALHELRAAVASSAGDGAAADRHLQHGLALIARTPPTARITEARAGLLATMAMRTAATGQIAQARRLHLESATLYADLARGAGHGIAKTDPGERRAMQIDAATQLMAAARMADDLGQVDDAEREWSEARAVLSQVRAEDPARSDHRWRLATVDLRVGQSRFLRGLIDDAQRAVESSLAEASALAASDPRDPQVREVLAWALLTLADIHQRRGQMAKADPLCARAVDVARALVALEPASATWRRVLGRAELTLGQNAAYRGEWAAAARHMAAARAAYDELVVRDPDHQGYRRGAAIALAELAEAETALGRADQARHAWRAALAHLAWLARSAAPVARIEWAYGLRGYAAFERRLGRLGAARDPIEQALAVVEATPRVDNRTQHDFQRAAVIAETGFHRAASGRAREARNAWQRAAALLRDHARTTQLEPDGHKLLRQLDAALAGRGDGSRR